MTKAPKEVLYICQYVIAETDTNRHSRRTHMWHFLLASFAVFNIIFMLNPYLYITFAHK